MPPQFSLKMSNELVTLNVGGVTYTTTKATLTKYPDSKLGAMFSGRRPKKDGNGHYFIDRDGGLFKYVLNFLRCSTLRLPTDFKETSQLIAEADFYQILPMINELMTLEVKTTPPNDEGIDFKVKEITTGANKPEVRIIGSHGFQVNLATAIERRLQSFDPSIITWRGECLIAKFSHQKCAQILKEIGCSCLNTNYAAMSIEGDIVEIISEEWFCPARWAAD